jgi:hypothetical protein
MGLFKKPKLPQMSGNSAAYGDLAEARAEAQRLEGVTLPSLQRNLMAPPPAQQTARDVAAAERMARTNMAKKRGIGNSIKPLGGGFGQL